jgi:hypothetical protein
MPETTVVLLPTHPVLSETTATLGQGGCLTAFGLPFVAAGAYLAWVTKVHPEQLFFSGPPMPVPFIYALASLFVVSGLILWSVALRAILAGFRLDRRRRRHVDDPWLGDRAWNPRGDREHPFSSTFKLLLGLGFLALFLLPFHWWMSADPWIPGILILALFDLFFLGGLAYFLYVVGRSIKYGAAWITYDRFPFFLGETLGVRLGCRGRLDRFDKVTVTLRFIEVKRERHGNSKNRVCYQHWAEQLVVDPRLLGDPLVLPVSMTLPTGDYGTCFSGDPPRYWEIEAKGEAPGIDFLTRFLVPVYSRP